MATTTIAYYAHFLRLISGFLPFEGFDSVSATLLILLILSIAWAVASARWQALNSGEPIVMVHIDTLGQRMSFWTLRPRLADRPRGKRKFDVITERHFHKLYTLPLACVTEATFSYSGATFVLDVRNHGGLVEMLPVPAPWWALVQWAQHINGEAEIRTHFNQPGRVSRWLARLRCLPWPITFSERIYRTDGTPTLIVDENLIEVQ